MFLSDVLLLPEMQDEEDANGDGDDMEIAEAAARCEDGDDQANDDSHHEEAGEPETEG